MAKKVPTCILCGKDGEKANFMISGPNGNHLCDECIAMCGIIANKTYVNIFCSDKEFEQNEQGEVWFGKQDEDDAMRVLSQEEIDDVVNATIALKEWEEQDIQTSSQSFVVPDFDPYMEYDDEVVFGVRDEENDNESTLFEKYFDNTVVKSMTPKEIRAYLDRFVIGQDQAKKVLSVAVYNHIKRLQDKTGLIKKSNILLCGPSGSGKTLLAETLAKLMDVPFAIADATSLTEAGYVGDDVENVITRLLNAADGDVRKAELGIVFIDEIDKIARSSGNRSISRDVSGEGVQQALLKIIEGAEVSVPVEGGRKHPYGNNVMVDTSNILFICGGAFEGIGENKDKKKTVGFNAYSSSNDENQRNEKHGSEKGCECSYEGGLATEDFVKYGMMPEFMGRLPIIVELSELTKEQLVQVLTEPENSILKGYEELLRQDGVELSFEEEALYELADIAISRKIGARGLRSIIEDIMLDIMYERPMSDDGTLKCIITKETIYTRIANLVSVA